MSVSDEEMLARIVTSPMDYNTSAGELLTVKLTSVYSVGLSVIRTGASNAEILDTISEMMGRQAESQSLIGAVVAKTAQIREMDDGERWFGVYATDAGIKEHHADIAGTFPSGPSKTQVRKTRDHRRYRLRDFMTAHLVRAETPAALLVALRQAGI